MSKHFFDVHTRVRKKLERAEQHIEELNREIESFFGKHPDGRFVYDDPKMAESVKSSYENSVLDLQISILTGEAIHQIRSSLDHLVNALVLKDGGTATTATQFPIFLYEPIKAKYVRRYEAQIAGITRPKVLDYIKLQQPYHRGDRRGGHWLGILKKFNNADKHATLLLHVVDVRPRIRVNSLFEKQGRLGTFEGPDDGTYPTDSFVRPDGEFIEIVNVQRHLAMDIAFSEWGDTGQTMGVVEGLWTFRTQVGAIVSDLSVFL